MLADEPLPHQEGFADFRAQIARGCRRCTDDVGRVPQVIARAHVARLNGGLKATTPLTYGRIPQARVAEGDAIPQASMALVHCPAAEGKAVLLSRRAHVAVDKGHVIANNNWPLRMALDQGVHEEATTSHSSMP